MEGDTPGDITQEEYDQFLIDVANFPSVIELLPDGTYEILVATDEAQSILVPLGSPYTGV